jgi:hypothetical protein
MSLARLGPKIAQEGNKQEVPVEDNTSGALLTDALKELKILNLHMSVLSDNTFDKQDVE